MRRRREGSTSSSASDSRQKRRRRDEQLTFSAPAGTPQFWGELLHIITARRRAVAQLVQLASFSPPDASVLCDPTPTVIPAGGPLVTPGATGGVGATLADETPRLNVPPPDPGSCVVPPSAASAAAAPATGRPARSSQQGPQPQTASSPPGLTPPRRPPPAPAAGGGTPPAQSTPRSASRSQKSGAAAPAPPPSPAERQRTPEEASARRRRSPAARESHPPAPQSGARYFYDSVSPSPRDAARAMGPPPPAPAPAPPAAAGAAAASGSAAPAAAAAAAAATRPPPAEPPRSPLLPPPELPQAPPREGAPLRRASFSFSAPPQPQPEPQQPPRPQPEQPQPEQPQPEQPQPEQPQPQQPQPQQPQPQQLQRVHQSRRPSARPEQLPEARRPSAPPEPPPQPPPQLQEEPAAAQPPAADLGEWVRPPRRQRTPQPPGRCSSPPPAGGVALKPCGAPPPEQLPAGLFLHVRSGQAAAPPPSAEQIAQAETMLFGGPAAAAPAVADAAADCGQFRAPRQLRSRTPGASAAAPAGEEAPACAPPAPAGRTPAAAAAAAPLRTPGSADAATPASALSAPTEGGPPLAPRGGAGADGPRHAPSPVPLQLQPGMPAPQQPPQLHARPPAQGQQQQQQQQQQPQQQRPWQQRPPPQQPTPPPQQQQQQQQPLRPPQAPPPASCPPPQRQQPSAPGGAQPQPPPQAPAAYQPQQRFPQQLQRPASPPPEQRPATPPAGLHQQGQHRYQQWQQQQPQLPLRPGTPPAEQRPASPPAAFPPHGQQHYYQPQEQHRPTTPPAEPWRQPRAPTPVQQQQQQQQQQAPPRPATPPARTQRVLQSATQPQQQQQPPRALGPAPPSWDSKRPVHYACQFSIRDALRGDAQLACGGSPPAVAALTPRRVTVHRLVVKYVRPDVPDWGSVQVLEVHAAAHDPDLSAMCLSPTADCLCVAGGSGTAAGYSCAARGGCPARADTFPAGALWVIPDAAGRPGRLTCLLSAAPAAGAPWQLFASGAGGAAETVVAHPARPAPARLPQPQSGVASVWWMAMLAGCSGVLCGLGQTHSGFVYVLWNISRPGATELLRTGDVPGDFANRPLPPATAGRFCALPIENRARGPLLGLLSTSTDEQGSCVLRRSVDPVLDYGRFAAGGMDGSTGRVAAHSISPCGKHIAVAGAGHYLRIYALDRAPRPWVILDVASSLGLGPEPSSGGRDGPGADISAVAFHPVLSLVTVLYAGRVAVFYGHLQEHAAQP